MFRTNYATLLTDRKPDLSAALSQSCPGMNVAPSKTDTAPILACPHKPKMNQIVSDQSCSLDEFMDNNTRSGIHGTRIVADSKSESHKQIMRIDSAKRKIIIETYKYMDAGGINNGLKVFIRMFAENPQYKNIWPQFRAITDSSLMSSDALRNHVRVNMGGMSTIVELMSGDDETEFRNLIRRMARSHAKYGVHKYHIMSMLPEFVGVLKLSGVDLTPEIEQAWTTVFDVIGNLLSKL